MEPLPENGPRTAARELGGDRLELLAWLRRNAPSLAELYEGAVTMLMTAPPGHVRLIARAVREIRNGLPEAVSGPKAGGRLDYTSRVDGILETWMQAGLVPVELAASELPPSETTLAVPRAAAKPVLQLLRDHQFARERPIEAARRLFVGVAPENKEFVDTLQPVVQHWLKVTKWFVARAHDNGQCDADCPREELERQFALFEKTLMAVVRGFYTAVSELDEILEDANS